MGRSIPLLAVIVLLASCSLSVVTALKADYLALAFQTDMVTYAYINLEPNHIAIGEAVNVSMLIEPTPPVSVGRFDGLLVRVILPDGTVETLGPFVSNKDGSVCTLYSPKNYGTYALQLVYPGESFANDTLAYQPAESLIAGLSVRFPSEIPPPSPDMPPDAALTPGAVSSENSWAKKTRMNQARGSLGVAVVNGRIYAIGGSTQSGLYPPTLNGGFVGTNEEYNPATDTWTLRAPMPTPRSDFAITVYQNKIYCIGGVVGIGRDSTYSLFPAFILSGVNEVYDPATDTWDTRAPVPKAGMSMRAAVLDGKIYVIDGKLNEVYDLTNNSWTTKSPTPIPAEDFSADGSNAYALFLSDNKLHVAGIFSRHLFTYDHAADRWDEGVEFPVSDFYYLMAGATTGVMAPKRLYFLFAIRGNVPVASNQVYDPSGKFWITGKPISTNRVDFGLAVIEDKFYAVGGYAVTFMGRFNASSANEVYTPIGYGAPDAASSPPSLQTPQNESTTTSPSTSPSPTDPSHSKETDTFSTGLFVLASIALTVGIVGLLVTYLKKRRH